MKPGDKIAFRKKSGRSSFYPEKQGTIAAIENGKMKIVVPGEPTWNVWPRETGGNDIVKLITQ